MKADDAKRLKELEKENARLKKLVADQALDIDMLKELAGETSDPGPPPAGRRDAHASGSGSPNAGPVAWSASPAPPSASPAPIPSDDELALRAFLRTSPRARPRWGWRRAATAARDAGWRVNNKRIHRLWREEGLRVPYASARSPLRGIGVAVGAMCPIRPNVVWALDFQFDQTADGQDPQALNIIDEFTRECLAIDVERSIDADGVVTLPRAPRRRTRRAGLRALRQRARVHRLRRGRLVPLQRHRHRLHRPGITLAERLDRVVQRPPARRATSTASASTPCSRPRSSSRTGGSTTTSTGHTARTAGSPRSSSSRPGSTNNSSHSHSEWINNRGPLTTSQLVLIDEATDGLFSKQHEALVP